MKSYCLKCKQVTDSKNVTLGTTKNVRKIARSLCSVCGSKKAKFIPTLPVGEVSQKGGAIDIHKMMLPLLPKKGLTLPGYNYCGPGNPLDNGPPTNELDEICREHDIAYTYGNKEEADAKMLERLSKHTGKTIGEKAAKSLVVRALISLKQKLGLGNGQRC